MSIYNGEKLTGSTQLCYIVGVNRSIQLIIGSYANSAMCFNSLPKKPASVHPHEPNENECALLHLLSDFHRLIDHVLLNLPQVDRIRADCPGTLLQDRDRREVIVR